MSRIKGSVVVLVSAVAILVGHVLSAVPVSAQTPAAQTSPARPAPVVVPQGSPQPPRAAQPAGPVITPRIAKPGEVESDPIRCWWKADRTSVRVGERFGLVLTCSVIETGPITVVPVLNQLEPGALSLTPFEVVSGVAHDDVVVTPWRYIQREYAVRLLSDGFFGQDVMIPALTVTYNLQERGSGSQGRDQTYILPALPMRILSLVPRSADDIRDASGQTFASIESRRFRSSLATTTAWIAFAFAALFGIFAIVRATSQVRAKSRGVVKPLPASSLLGACLSALARVKGDASQAGWTSELSRRAASALRIAGAVALGRPVTQSMVGPDVIERDGQLAVSSGWPRRRRVLLSAATTSRTIASGLSNGGLSNGGLSNGHRPSAQARASLESISDALGVLSTAGYGRQTKEDTSALDSALAESIQAVRRIRAGTLWPLRTVQALRAFVGF
jgi:hypothetical protein